MKGTDGRERPDVGLWKLVDYDQTCQAYSVLRNQINDVIMESPNAVTVLGNLSYLNRQIRECIYDRLERGGKHDVPTLQKAATFKMP
jgi:hypothetical protein